MPSSCQISLTDCEALIEAATSQLSFDCLQSLLQLTGSQAVPAEGVKRLMQWAVKVRFKAPVSMLCKLPAAQSLSTDDVEQLLLQAVQVCTQRQLVVLPLLELPAVQQLNSGSIVRLCVAACYTAAREIVPKLALLPNARYIETAAARRVLQAAIEQKDLAIVESICKLPGLQQLPAQDVLPILRGLLHDTCGDEITTFASEVVALLVNLAGASAIPVDAVYELLQVSDQCRVYAGRVTCAQGLFQMRMSVSRDSKQLS